MAGDRRPWFGAKTFGIGVRPVAWQGWAVVSVAALGVVILRRVLNLL